MMMGYMMGSIVELGTLRLTQTAPRRTNLSANNQTLIIKKEADS